MEYREGLFGVLNMDEMKNEPLVLLDGGIECRCGEAYDFYNGNRTEYGGFLFQYTLRGEGLFVRNGRECLVKKGSGFFVRFPEESRYCLPDEPGAVWEFLYLHFEGSAADAFADKTGSALSRTDRIGSGKCAGADGAESSGPIDRKRTAGKNMKAENFFTAFSARFCGRWNVRGNR